MSASFSSRKSLPPAQSRPCSFIGVIRADRFASMELLKCLPKCDFEELLACDAVWIYSQPVGNAACHQLNSKSSCQSEPVFFFFPSASFTTAKETAAAPFSQLLLLRPVIIIITGSSRDGNSGIWAQAFSKFTLFNSWKCYFFNSDGV